MIRSQQPRAIHSQPTDSLLKPMMYRSDNFYAEQTLLMVSNQKLGLMSDRLIIDTILKTDLADLPQAPRWVDGSGLSRYNLFTPQTFVAILNKMREQFGMDRLKSIFPTGGTGTLGSFYKKDSGYIYAKTGTLSGVVALSGYLYTHKNKLVIFSVLVNNHNGNAVAVKAQCKKKKKRSLHSPVFVIRWKLECQTNQLLNASVPYSVFLPFYFHTVSIQHIPQST